MNQAEKKMEFRNMFPGVQVERAANLPREPKFAPANFGRGFDSFRGELMAFVRAAAARRGFLRVLTNSARRWQSLEFFLSIKASPGSERGGREPHGSMPCALETARPMSGRRAVSMLLKDSLHSRPNARRARFWVRTAMPAAATNESGHARALPLTRLRDSVP
jgi:hypothetical protein